MLIVNLTEQLLDADVPKLRAKQISAHYFRHYSPNPESWTDIAKEEREELFTRAFSGGFTPIENEKELVGDSGSTVKTLWKLNDGEVVESVLMHYSSAAEFAQSEFEVDEAESSDQALDTAQVNAAQASVSRSRNTLCISSQVGCQMGCPFCATGMLGFKRNLTEFELLEQVREAFKKCAENGWGSLNNIVFMGEGEPTANLENVLAAIMTATAPLPTGFEMSRNNITVSTVGVPSGIKALADSGLNVRLAVSLHAPTNSLRDELVPMNKKYPIEEVLKSAFDYFKQTRRRVSIEYAMMEGVNDSEELAFTLAKQLNRLGSGWVHCNLIPLNEVKGSQFHPATAFDTAIFLETLKSKGIPSTLRDSRGQDIDGACGQLASAEPTAGENG